MIAALHAERSRVMSMGEKLYLALVLAVFVGFSVTLLTQPWSAGRAR